jgi:chemotaxis protein CheD
MNSDNILSGQAPHLMTGADGNPIIVVGIADIKVGKAPHNVRTTLGSCIALCLYNAQMQAGGMLHLMMAEPPAVELAKGEIQKKAKYARTGIPELLRQMRISFGLEPAQLTAKMFGGANLLPNVTRNIGQENEVAVREILRGYGIRITGYMTGGTKGYKVDFDLNTGKVRCQLFGEAAQEI